MVQALHFRFILKFRNCAVLDLAMVTQSYLPFNWCNTLKCIIQRKSLTNIKINPCEYV